MNEVEQEVSVQSVPRKEPHIKCTCCDALIRKEDLRRNYYCCPFCDKHFHISANKRVKMIFDVESLKEWGKYNNTKNILGFPEYKEEIKRLQRRTGLLEAVITGEATIDGMKVALAIIEINFLQGSMGQIVGEKITAMIERATDLKLPIITFTASRGSRIQEGIVSLLQIAKISAALKAHSNAKLLYISVLTDPTVGNVMAFSMLGDILIAEPNAYISFASADIIESEIDGKPHKNFQKSELLLEKGFIDKIVHRKNMRNLLSRLLYIYNV